MSRGRRPSILGAIAGRFTNAFRALASGIGQALPPWDDYWYQRPGMDSAAGMSVSPETAMRLSAVLACVRVRSETFGACLPVIIRRYTDGREELAPEHPLYDVICRRPNQWQTSMEFFEMQQAHLDLRGNAFSRIIGGPRGPIDQLVPLHPDLVQVFRLPNGRLKYQVRSRFTAEIDWYTQDEILHLRGLSSDGLVGLSPIALQREMLGRGLAMQDYGARFFANSSKPPGVIKHPGKFKDDAARQNFRQSWRDAQTGENQHKTAVLEDGMEYQAIGISNADSQFIEATKLNREEIAGIYRVPPHKIAILERSTNNNIEHQGIEFVTDCMHPIASRWEARINSDLVEPLEIAAPGSEYLIKFRLDGLLRGDLKSRYDAYAVGRNGGWLSPNDICQLENRNPIPAEKGGDDYLRPVNYVVAGSSQPATPQGQPGPGQSDPPPDNSDSADPNQDTPAARAAAAAVHELKLDSAKRVVRKEVGALRKSFARATGSQEFDSALFEREATAFYADHPEYISGLMHVPLDSAKTYVEEKLTMLVGVDGAGAKASVIDWIEDCGPGELAERALAVKGIKR
jgi:HK97 family phage portal protein